ncbi:hypothetical protein FSO04_12040 [Paraburkholderia madseniana]|uniref:Uncharacterized protein n=1 Tax=Paraburkholderia madseniana TaxID=2599607 RepID=A0A6N6WJM5_9BURK|nr:hypothetical protein [Paraburkholderia madseniana]KAE8759630.1 hypothetical protein FSO04_12040 [Paraburkholderia madseniana]
MLNADATGLTKLKPLRITLRIYRVIFEMANVSNCNDDHTTMSNVSFLRVLTAGQTVENQRQYIAAVG